MLRAICVLICGGCLLGCSTTGGQGALFNGANARVPPPATGSYSKPGGSDYYNKSSSLFSAPGGRAATDAPNDTFGGFASTGAGTVGAGALGSGVRDENSLPWQTPRVAPAGYYENANAGAAPLVTPNNAPSSFGEPRPFPGNTVRDFAELPAPSSAPRIRFPGSMPATDATFQQYPANSPADNPFRATTPPPTTSAPATYAPATFSPTFSSAPAGTNDGELRWGRR